MGSIDNKSIEDKSRHQNVTSSHMFSPPQWPFNALRYQAPEILDEKIYEGAPADIFSAGVILFLLLGGHPPFKTATASDPWYGYIAKGNYEKFWEIQEKKKPKERFMKDSQTQFFQPDFRDIVSKMLDCDPTKRITIEEIKEHPWYKGLVVTNEELATEFNAYKSLIDKVLEKEKIERREQKKLAEAIQLNGKASQSTFNGYVPYRDGEIVSYHWSQAC